MIRIFNQKIDVEIKIDDSVDWVQLIPRDYDEKPFISIELNGFDFLRHTKSCEDCSKFLNAFGHESVDWYVEYLGKIQRIDTTYLSKGFGKNHISHTISDYFTGTKITLGFNPLPNDKAILREILIDDLLNENYERACVIRDLLKE